MKRYAIPDIARKYVEYDMIQEHTELPEMAEPRLRVLYAFLSEHDRLEPFGRLYTLVVSLVQLGLDTHDLIDTREEKRPEREMRSRQLKVLAGDYFSARFYQLLAQSGQIEMVAQISHAVCEVNRLKVNLYMRMRQHKLTAEEYLDSMIALRSELFHLFNGMMDVELARAWPAILAAVSQAETLAAELKRSTDPSLFGQSWAYWHVIQQGTEEERARLSEGNWTADYLSGLNHKYDSQHVLTVKLQQATEAVKVLAEKLHSEALMAEVTAVAHSLMTATSDLAPAINEMR